MRTASKGLILLLAACTTPSVAENPQDDAGGSDSIGEADGGSEDGGSEESGSDEGGLTDTSDTSTGGLDTAVADAGEGAGGDDGSDGGSDTSGGGESAVMMADFQLEDLNPMSPRYGEVVSPRDYIEEVSGWYFIKGS